MVEITDRAALERWLGGQPREAAVAIAARAALRTIPLLISGLSIDDRARREALILPVFRAVSGAWIAATDSVASNQIIDACAKASTQALSVTEYTHAGRMTALHEARTAAKLAADTAVGNPMAARTCAAKTVSAAIMAAARAAANTTVTNIPLADYEFAWSDVSHDVTALERGTAPIIVAREPLWVKSPPRWAATAWDQLKAHLLNTGESWEVWTDWYENRLHGRRFDNALEEARVLINEDLWEQGPKAVNAEIKRLVHQYKDNGTVAPVEPKNGPETPVLGRGEQRLSQLRTEAHGETEGNRGKQRLSPLRSGAAAPLPSVEDAGEQTEAGYTFGGPVDGPIRLMDPAQSGKARDDEIAREFHGEARAAALALLERCKRSNQLHDLGNATRQYLDRLGNDPSEVRQSLLLQGERLRNLRDADLRLQQAHDPLTEPMPEDAFADLQTLIAAHNQYVSTDPALASSQRALSDPEETAIADVMPDEALDAVEDLSPILDEAARDALREAAEAARPDSPAGRRARAWLGNSWRNLAVETSRRVLFTLRKCAEAFYDEAALASELSVEQAIEAARALARQMDERRTQAALGLTTMSQAPRVTQALAEFAARHDAAGRAVRAAETVAEGALMTVGGGLGLVLLALVADRLGRWGWFRDLIENPSVRKVFERLRP